MNAPLNLVQGSQEWLDFRASHYGASEAAAMLGLSPYMSRNALLEYKATGKSKEYSDWFQKNILDNGHAVEAKAREILEQEIQDDLFPVTCSEGKLSASCDGLTMSGTIAFECKQWNRDLADHVREHNAPPDSHMPQCQQILMVTGAEEVVFVVTDGTKDKYVTAEVLPDPVWFDRIRSGWAQFESDLANYQPKEFAEKLEPAAIMQLPALSIQIKGEVTLSNLPQFKEAAEDFIAKINTDLKTDQDFATAEATVKFCDETERKLEAAKEAAIGQTASIDELMRTIDFIKEQIRGKRLTLDKLVKSQKESIKREIIDDAANVCLKHMLDIGNEFNGIIFSEIARSVYNRSMLESACKNKRTLASLHNAVDTEVAAIKIKLDELARVIRKNLTHLPDDLSLFRDLQSIITKQEEDFKLLVESRLTEQKRKEEEAAKRAAEEVKAAEERGRAQAAAAAERELLAKEAEVKRLERVAQAQAELEARNAELKRREAQTNRSTKLHREKIIEEAVASVKALSDHTPAGIVEAILTGKIKHVQINF